MHHRSEELLSYHANRAHLLTRWPSEAGSSSTWLLKQDLEKTDTIPNPIININHDDMDLELTCTSPG